ncbi:MAG TPA: AraC family transcriptional regulator [Flavisolibacter sp.]|nr:AraC family transcriptional regulator [Flavisolibacter sp.]
MFYKKVPPSPLLTGYVECYYVWEHENTSGKVFEVESPPSAYTAFVFNYGDDYSVSSKNSEKQFVSKQFLVGQLTKSYSLHFPGQIGTAVIVFKPTGISSIFKIPMFAFTNERIDLRAFIDSSAVEALSKKINCHTTPEEKIIALEEFLLEYLQMNNPAPDVIDKAANLIVEKHGQVNINELCSQLYISRRQFERKFLYKVGLSPKFYARMRRIGYICYQIAGKKAVNWQDLYYDLDYYDQSHFIKDFTEFTGRSPREYFNNNAELIHHLKMENN